MMPADLRREMSRHAARTSYACLSCHRRKRKCDGKSPCSVCQSRHIHCQYDPDKDQRRSLRRRPGSHHDVNGATSLGTSAVSSEAFLNITSPKWPKVTPGSLSFGLMVGEHGELEYRGPTSSVTGDRLPTAPSRQSVNPEESTSMRELPDANEMRRHLDIFVEWQNSSVLVLSGCTINSFMDDYPPPLEDFATRVVLWSILSLTYKIHGIGRLNFEERASCSDAAIAEATQLVMTLAFRRPSIEIVQSASILACREYSCGHENSAWVFHGIATTVCGSIGLHAGRDYDKWIASGHLSPRRVEARIVTYWAVVLVDRMLGSCLGRNCLLHPTDFSTPEIKLRILAVSMGKRNITLVEGSSSYTDSVLNTFRCAVDLWKLTDETLSQIYIWQHDLIRLRQDTRQLSTILNKLSGVVKNSHARYHAWNRSLPSALSLPQSGPLPHLLLLNMTYHSHQILVHRPFLYLLHLSDNNETILSGSQDLAVSAPMVCRKSAVEILTLCRTYREHYTLQCIVFMVAHFLLNACTIHIIDRDNADADIARGATSALEDGLAVLEEMGEVWDVAQNAAALVNELKEYHETREPGSLGRSGIAEESSVTDFQEMDKEVETRDSFNSWGFLTQPQDVWSIALMKPYVPQANIP